MQMREERGKQKRLNPKKGQENGTRHSDSIPRERAQPPLLMAFLNALRGDLSTSLC